MFLVETFGAKKSPQKPSPLLEGKNQNPKSDWDSVAPDADTFSLMLGKADDAIIWGGNYFSLPPSQAFLVWDKKQPEDLTLSMCEQAWCSSMQPREEFEPIIPPKADLIVMIKREDWARRRKAREERESAEEKAYIARVEAERKEDALLGTHERTALEKRLDEILAAKESRRTQETA